MKSKKFWSLEGGGGASLDPLMLLQWRPYPEVGRKSKS